MTSTILSLPEVAAKRTEQIRSTRALRTFSAKMSLRATTVDGKDVLHLDGYASVTEEPYEMWDMFGPYSEVISHGAFGKTLSEGADVALLLNHGGMTLARTKPGTLRLAEDTTGLHVDADLSPRMTVVNDMSIALERGDLDEMSFAFWVTRGSWSPDWTQYRVDEVDMNKGDVSVVNYGANPATSVALRARDLMGALDHIGDEQARQIQDRIAARLARGAGDPPPATQPQRNIAELAYLASL